MILLFAGKLSYNNSKHLIIRKKKIAGKSSRLEANPRKPRKFSTANNLHYRVITCMQTVQLLITIIDRSRYVASSSHHCVWLQHTASQPPHGYIGSYSLHYCHFLKFIFSCLAIAIRVRNYVVGYNYSCIAIAKYTQLYSQLDS